MPLSSMQSNSNPEHLLFIAEKGSSLQGPEQLLKAIEQFKLPI